MSVEVVTVMSRWPDTVRESYYRPDVFLKSLERFGVKPTVLGLGEPWGGLMTKPRRLRQWLRQGNCKSETLIVCDAFDIVFTASAQEIAEKYISETMIYDQQPIMFNGEQAIFPRPELAYAFDDVNTPWCYLNSGFMIAPPDLILSLLEAMWLDDIANDHQGTSDLDGGAGRWVNPNDQGWYQLMFAAGVVPMAIDEECAICQCLSGCTIDDFDLSGERIKNVAYNSHPLVFHFNGGSKNDLMPIFLKKWGLE